jgi:hypothetical protein
VERGRSAAWLATSVKLFWAFEANDTTTIDTLIPRRTADVAPTAEVA